MIQILVENDVVIIYDDGTYRCRDWNLTQLSHWKVDVDCTFWFKHHVDHDYRMAGMFDRSATQQWAKLIVDKLIEREIFSE